jgi:DNA-binding IclR family transcriptional regulator
LRWMVSEGALLPLHLGSAGHVLTGEVGRHGWVETVEEREPGVASVSAPITAPTTGVLAAVSVGGPIDRLTRQPGKHFGTDVVSAAADIAALL